MYKFKIGDKVLCENALGTSLSEGEIYTVASVKEMGGEQFLIFDGDIFWYAGRFTLVESEYV
jgi:hypothetical protein